MESERKHINFDAQIIQELALHPEHEGKEYLNFRYYSDGDYPKELIDKQRPNEQPQVKLYREETYKPVFCEVFTRVLNALSKIHRADGYFLKYPKQNFSKIRKGETLEDYLTYQFTASKSLIEWTFQVGLKQYITDANGVCILWSDEVASTTEYKKPTPFIINSDRIIYSYEGHSVVYKDEHDANVYYSIDNYAWQKWRRKKKGNGYELEIETIHNLGIFPGFTLGGVVEEEEELGREYNSRINGMLPWLDVATIEFSDLRAEITQHIHSTVWVYQDEQCPTCSGVGFLMRDNEKVPCTNTKCKGGQIPVSPFDIIRVRAPKTMMGEVAAPTPPMGYIQKQTEIAELQDKRINEMRYRALAAINMQFLEQLPAAQSGIAKAYDREETNNTFYGIAIDLGRVMENIAYLCGVWRYSAIYSLEEIKTMVPTCVVPNTFDIIGSNVLIEEIKAVRDSKLNGATQSEIELEFIKKRFPDNVRLQNTMKDAFLLDPASGKTDEEKAFLVSNRIMSKQDAIISTYIHDFIDKAYAENESFNTLTKEQKMQVMYKFADEKIKTINAKDLLVNKIYGTTTEDKVSGSKNPSDLKYTVGGLTGIIEIVKAVSSGVYDLEAAIQMVMDRFGLTYEQAKAQLGTPQIVNSQEDIDKITKLT